MASLSERDRRVIFGDSLPIPDTPSDQRKQENLIDYADRRFTAAAAMLVGICLFGSALRNAEGTRFVIQNAVAVLIFLAGIAWYISLRRSEAFALKRNTLAEAAGRGQVVVPAITVTEGLDLGVLRRCPRHPDVLISVGDGPVAGLSMELADAVEAAPRSCPRCSEEDE